MKIITKVVFDLETMEVITQEAFEYEGLMAQCKGGGTSGSVDWPAYMKTVHGDWLDNAGGSTSTIDMVTVMNAAIGGSPYSGKAAFDPATDLANSTAAIATFAAILAGIVDTTDWAALYAQAVTSLGGFTPIVIADKAPIVISGATITTDVAAFAAEQDDNVTVNVLPRFRRGMQDINAVVSSAFPIGEAIIEAFQARDVAKYDASLRREVVMKNAELEDVVNRANLEKDIRVAGLNNQTELEYKKLYLGGTESILRIMLQRIAWNESLMRTVIDSNRIAIVAKKEQTDHDIEIDSKDALWDLECFQYGGNLLAAIGSGTSSTKQPSLLQSILGGALSVFGVAASLFGGNNEN
jgi:hypothetical protein